MAQPKEVAPFDLRTKAEQFQREPLGPSDGRESESPGNVAHGYGQNAYAIPDPPGAYPPSVTGEKSQSRPDAVTGEITSHTSWPYTKRDAHG